jgi:formylglycine-generating enzyme required for sulfatase activity
MFKANPWDILDILDILGNADEFVADCQHKNGYQGAPKDHKPWRDNCGGRRMYIRRGGAAIRAIFH